jgi:carboxylesterase
MVRNAAFYLRGGPCGVLLIHGLTGTPTEMRWVGKGLHQAGFTVYGMQLAGHCGGEEDLLATGWRDWYRSVNEAADRLLQDVEHLFVAGLSMGALLALRLAAQRPADVRGLGLYGTTFAYDGWTIPWIARLSFLLPFAIKLGTGRRRKRVAGNMLAGDSAAAGLPGNPWPALAEFEQLSRRVRTQLERVQAPCLVVHATNDDIASVSNAHLVQRRVSGPVQSLLLADSYHMVTVDRERHRVIEHSSEFFARIARHSAGGAAA